LAPFGERLFGSLSPHVTSPLYGVVPIFVTVTLKLHFAICAPSFEMLQQLAMAFSTFSFGPSPPGGRHTPSPIGTVPSGQPPGGLHTPSPIGTVPSGQPSLGLQVPSSRSRMPSGQPQ